MINILVINIKFTDFQLLMSFFLHIHSSPQHMTKLFSGAPQRVAPYGKIYTSPSVSVDAGFVSNENNQIMVQDTNATRKRLKLKLIKLMQHQ